MRTGRNALVAALAAALLIAGPPIVASAAATSPTLANQPPANQPRSTTAIAAALLPSTAKLRNPAGRTDGCSVSVSLPFLQVPQQGDMTIELRNKGYCPPRANIHWLALSSAVYQVLPTGSRVVLHSRALNWTESSPTDGPPLAGSTGIAGEYLDCQYYGLSGQVTLLLNVKLRAWSRQHDEAQVFHAVVERQQTVDCA